MKGLLGITVALLLTATPAYANSYEEDGDRNRNGRHCEGSQDCSSLSPSFEDSPVRDSFIFAPTICMPFADCRFDGDEPDPS